jgi:hypothetical protein
MPCGCITSQLTVSLRDVELGVRTHLSKEAKAFDNPMVQVDELSFTHSVNVDLRHLCPRCQEPRMPMTLYALVASADRR